MRNIIKQEIKKRGSIKEFAESIPIRKATLINYLNNKQDTGTDTLFKILEKLGWILNTPEGSAYPMNTIVINEKSVKVGQETQTDPFGKEISKHKCSVLCIVKSEKHTTIVYYVKDKDETVTKRFENK